VFEWSDEPLIVLRATVRDFAPDDSDLDQALRSDRAHAKRPVILFAGQGVVIRSGSTESAGAFVPRPTDIPVAPARCSAWAASRPRTRATWA
jgi:hypothetical protein